MQSLSECAELVCTCMVGCQTSRPYTAITPYVLRLLWPSLWCWCCRLLSPSGTPPKRACQTMQSLCRVCKAAEYAISNLCMQFMQKAEYAKLDAVCRACMHLYAEVVRDGITTLCENKCCLVANPNRFL